MVIERDDFDVFRVRHRKEEVLQLLIVGRRAREHVRERCVVLRRGGYPHLEVADALAERPRLDGHAVDGMNPAAGEQHLQPLVYVLAVL